jgi:hypothetical protein
VTLSAHAALPPSAYARWSACPGSVAAERGIERVETVYSAEGTLGHSVYTASLLTGWSPRLISPQAKPDLLDALEVSVGTTRSIIRNRRFLVEQRLAALPDEPAIWGTSDVVALDHAGRVADIIDLKLGAGVLVEASTPQLGVYGVLAAASYGVSHRGVSTWILQPRAEHSEGIARKHHYSADDLAAFRQKMLDAAAATRQTDAPRRAGPHCMFCAVRGECETRRQHELAGFGADTDLALVEPGSGASVAVEHEGLPFRAPGVMVNRQDFTKTANCWGVDNNISGTNTNRIVLAERI